MDRQLRQILSETEAGRAYLAQIDAAKKSRRARHAPTRKAKDAKRAAKRDCRAEIRAAVVARSGGRCEAWHAGPPGSPLAVRCHGRALEWDHFWSRRDPADETVEGTWMLCTRCHRMKTNNDPDRRGWLTSFWFHASRHEYGEQMLRAVAARSLEKAQHPETTR